MIAAASARRAPSLVMVACACAASQNSRFSSEFLAARRQTRRARLGVQQRAKVVGSAAARLAPQHAARSASAASSGGKAKVAPSVAAAASAAVSASAWPAAARSPASGNSVT